MLIDTHAHLWWDSYGQDLVQVLERAKAMGVEKIIVPGTDIESSRKAIELAKNYPGFLYGAVGVHPEEVLRVNAKFRSLAYNRARIGTRGTKLQTTLRSELGSKGAVAVGEIGTDANTEELKNCMDEQKKLFRAQCELALECDLPVIIHTRGSFTETWEVLTSLPSRPRGQFHCFSVDEEALQKVLGAGFYVSFCANITWSKRVAKMVSLVPDNRLLLETDSPFMQPRITKGGKVPNSGPESSEPRQGSELGRNEPANVMVIAEVIAHLRGTTIERIGEITTENANRLYQL